PARLEAATDLELLELEPELDAVDAELAAVDAQERRAADVRGDASRGRFDLVAADVDVHLEGGSGAVAILHRWTCLPLLLRARSRWRARSSASTPSAGNRTSR